MNTRRLLPYFVASVFILQLLACSSGTTQPTATLLPLPPAPTEAVTAQASEPPAATPEATEAPGGGISTPTPEVSGSSGGYVPVTADVCATIQELASQAVGLDFTMQASAAFTDSISGESGQGCTLTATTDGTKISDPNDALSKLVAGMMGWTEDTQYQAGGPTGAATGLRRDMGLMLISVGWTPSADANCSQDQPISACDLKPEQHLYTVQIQTAMK